MFSSLDSQQTTDFRYIEVYRGYSPTLEFEDDNAESLERTGISLNVFKRGERSKCYGLPPIWDPGFSLFLGARSQTKKE